MRADLRTHKVGIFIATKVAKTSHTAVFSPNISLKRFGIRDARAKTSFFSLTGQEKIIPL